jgi:hypothetical protein
MLARIDVRPHFINDIINMEGLDFAELGFSLGRIKQTISPYHDHGTVCLLIVTKNNFNQTSRIPEVAPSYENTNTRSG